MIVSFYPSRDAAPAAAVHPEEAEAEDEGGHRYVPYGRTTLRYV